MPIMLKGANAGGAWYPALTRTTPDNPPSGQLRLYGKTNQPSLFYRDHLGNEYELRPSQSVSTDSALYAMTELYPLRQYLAETFR